MALTDAEKHNKFTLSKIPATVKLAYFDSDPIAYRGAFAVEKTKYRFTNSETFEESPPFLSAKDAKAWLDGQQDIAESIGIEFRKQDWVRYDWKEPLSVEEAIKATQDVLQAYIKASGVHEDDWMGFLTQRGVEKTKDLPGLEHQYQGNRSGFTPTHLDATRQHLIDKSQMHLLSDGFEADAAVIAMGERKGKRAVILSLDKDLRQLMGGYMLDMSYDKAPLIFNTVDNPLGDVWRCPIKSKPKQPPKYVGCGFKWLCYQALAGDPSDGYYGISGVGGAAIIKLLDECETIHQCLDAIYALYKKKFPEGHTYTAWDGTEQHRTPEELMTQHFMLPYQERSMDDVFSFEKYGWSFNMNG